MAILLVPPYWQPLDADGNPLANGLVYTYAANTLTPKATYTDSTGATAHANPAELDSAGRIAIWGEGSYKFIVKDSLGNTIKTVDNVTTYSTLADEVDPYFESFSGTGSQTAYVLSEDVGTESKNLMIFVDAGLEACATNGAFASDTGWTKGSGWTIGSGVATATGAISTALSQTSAVTVVQGQAYRFTYTITRSAGGLIPSIGGTSGVERTASGTYSEVIIAGSTQTIAFTGNGFTGTLDNVFVNVVATAGRNVQDPATYTVNGTALTFNTAPPLGTNNILVFAPSLLLGAASNAVAAAEAAEAGALAAQVAAEAAQTAAELAETNAETAEAAAELAASALYGTSATSVAIATGSTVFTTQAGKQFDVGNWLLIASDANEANYMHGQVTAYTGTTLTVNVTNIGGSGTLADWKISISGTRGATGATGPGGDMSGSNNLSELTNPATAFSNIKQAASETATGVVELATNAETVTGTDTARAVTPAGVAAAIDASFTLATAVASTSGTTIDFSSIPAGTKKITINFVGVSTDGTSNPLVQLGDAGGVEATGYLGAGDNGTTVANFITGFGINTANAATVLHGSIVLNLVDAATFTWTANGIFAHSNNGVVQKTAGSKSLSAELDRVRITTVNGTDAFDAGVINITYEG